MIFGKKDKKTELKEIKTRKIKDSKTEFKLDHKVVYDHDGGYPLTHSERDSYYFIEFTEKNSPIKNKDVIIVGKFRVNASSAVHDGGLEKEKQFGQDLDQKLNQELGWGYGDENSLDKLYNQYTIRYGYNSELIFKKTMSELLPLQENYKEAMKTVELMRDGIKLKDERIKHLEGQIVLQQDKIGIIQEQLRQKMDDSFKGSTESS